MRIGWDSSSSLVPQELGLFLNRNNGVQQLFGFCEDVSGVVDTGCNEYINPKIVAAWFNISTISTSPSFLANSAPSKSLLQKRYCLSPTYFHHETPRCHRRNCLARTSSSQRPIPSSLRQIRPIWNLHNQSDVLQEGRLLCSARLHFLQCARYWMLL